MNVIEKIYYVITGYKKKEAKGLVAWVVTWDARHGIYCGNTRKKAKVFIEKEDAEMFAKSLRKAQNLLQYTEDINITITKQE